MKLTIYRGNESRTIPAVDFGGAWIAQGWSTEPQAEPETVSESATPPESTESTTLPALALLNSAESAADIEVLPSVGRATAKILFDRRPEGGYLSLNQAEEINSDKTHIDWEAIALWEG